MIKKIVSIVLLIFVTFIIVVFISHLFFLNSTTNSFSSSTSTVASSSQDSKVQLDPKAVTISAQEVAKHNQASDCWQIISGDVYNLTSFLGQHPGGEKIMLPYCGKDATQAYDTKGGQGDPHSGRADRMLRDYFVGRLGKN